MEVFHLYKRPKICAKLVQCYFKNHQKMYQISLLLVVIGIFNLSEASPRPFDTNLCGINSKTYCITERQYVPCKTELSDDLTLYTCPLPGQFCADIIGTCTSDTTIAATTNTYCDLCSSVTGKSHACTSYNTFEICEGGAFTRSDLNVCRPGTYCDATHPNPDNPCVPFSGSQLLCWKEFTPQPPISDVDLCASLKNGRHADVTDPSCKKYVRHFDYYYCFF